MNALISRLSFKVIKPKSIGYIVLLSMHCIFNPHTTNFDVTWHEHGNHGDLSQLYHPSNRTSKQH